MTNGVLEPFFKSIESSKSCPKHITGLEMNLSHFTVNLGSEFE